MTVTTDNNCHLKPISGELDEADSKYCINNHSQIINQHESSGGVEALFAKKSHTVRLSISPSQGSFSLVNHQKTTIPGSNPFEINHFDRLDQKDLEYDKKSIENIIKSTNFWDSFRSYLLELNTEKTIYSRLSYAKRYYDLLISRNFHELHTMSKDKRIHIMKALTSLSKYLGIYDRWKDIVTKFNLKWSSGFNGIEVFKKIIEPVNTLDSMIPSLRSTLKNCDIPIGHRNILLYCTMTGLRASEAIESIKLIKNENSRLKYISNDKEMIKHYEFPEIFIRRTKKAYCSVIIADLIELVFSCSVMNVAAFRSYFTKRKIPLNMNYGRKIFATYLRNKGIEPEIIDLLQGRIGSSVFVNHYYRPDIKEIITKKIRPVLNELRKELL
jgi:intergrase/recombinase